MNLSFAPPPSGVISLTLVVSHTLVLSLTHISHSFSPSLSLSRVPVSLSHTRLVLSL